MKPTTIPYGLRVIRVLSIASLVLLSVAFSLLLFSAPASEVSSFASSWMYFSILFSIVFSVLTIIAINTKSAKLYKLLLWVSALELILFITSLFTRDIEALLVNVMVMVLTVFLIWYWVKIKGYFFDASFNSEDPVIKKLDKKVNPFLIIFFTVLVLIIVVTSGVTTVRDTKNILSYAEGFKDKDLQGKIDFCASQEDGDRCRVTAFATEKDTRSIGVEKCDLMTSEEGKFSCYVILDKCDVVTDEKLKSTCNLASDQFRQKMQKYATSTASTTAQ